MKILYGAGNRPGANLQLKRFLGHCNLDIRCAAYFHGSDLLECVDWTLDALQSNNSYDKGKLNSLFGYEGAPHIDYNHAQILLEEVYAWKPDLVISDAEPITAHIAKALELRLWYCSPLLLINGIEWERKQHKYSFAIKKMYKTLQTLPQAERKLVYSPFCDISMRPRLKDGFEWCKPYSETESFGKINTMSPQRVENDCFKYIQQNLKNNQVLTTGETSFVADAIYSGYNIAVAPAISDPESLTNASLCEYYFLGSDLGEIETSIEYAQHQFDRFLTRPFTNALSIQDWKCLHEILNM